MPTLYDDIMSLLHEAGVFAEYEKQENVARSVRHTRQIAETEFLLETGKPLSVKRRASLAANAGNLTQRLEASC